MADQLIQGPYAARSTLGGSPFPPIADYGFLSDCEVSALVRDMVLKNQVVLGTVNAGADAFASALRNLDAFRRRWPAVVATFIAGRYPAEQAPDLILGRPAGIKTVIAFDPP